MIIFRRRSLNAALLFSLLLVTSKHELQAGDAVVIGYNPDGVWTAVIYYCSSTPKGGADYKEESAAREAAVRDLKKRAGEDLAKVSVLAASDRTGHFAYARGKMRGGEDAHVVGFGATKEEAERQAFAQLQSREATAGQKVIYNYFSYGADPAPAPRAR